MAGLILLRLQDLMVIKALIIQLKTTLLIRRLRNIQTGSMILLKTSELV